MKNISTGTGLCVLGLCLASYPIIDRVMPRAEAGATHVAAVVAAATAQVPPEPTIVWYGVTSSTVEPMGNGYGRDMPVIIRAWSDGRVEANRGYIVRSQSGVCSWIGNTCSEQSPWVVVSDPNQGYTSSADINFDSKVDGADLGQVLAMWGDAPRHDVPPSTCPLNLINP
jgi:hypothetical protein